MVNLVHKILNCMMWMECSLLAREKWWERKEKVCLSYWVWVTFQGRTVKHREGRWYGSWYRNSKNSVVVWWSHLLPYDFEDSAVQHSSSFSRKIRHGVALKMTTKVWWNTPILHELNALESSLGKNTIFNSWMLRAAEVGQKKSVLIFVWSDRNGRNQQFEWLACTPACARWAPIY